MPVRGAEAHWEAVQRAVDEHLDAEGNGHLAQLGREYVAAMRSGARLRELAEATPQVKLKSGRIVVNPLWEASDRDIRRGIQLAKALELNKPSSRAAKTVFAELDAAEGKPISLDARRKKRARARKAAAKQTQRGSDEHA